MRLQILIVFIIFSSRYSHCQTTDTSYRDIADEFYMNQNYDSALIYYNKAIKVNSNNSYLYKMRAFTKAEFKDYYNEAISDFSKAIELNPEAFFAFIGRAELKNYLGMYKEAIDDFNSAIEIRPDRYEYYYKRGVAFNNFKRYAEAISDFNIAIKNDPKNENAYFQRGYAKHAMKDYLGAMTDYNRL